MSSRDDLQARGPLEGLIRFCLQNKLVVVLLTLLMIGWGVRVAPFDWDIDLLPRDPVAVDAIPDIGENQQIVFTNWPGRSPQDVEDQVTYPLTVALLGIPGVETIRSFSYFGFSSVYVIFEEDVEFYWSRSRILEKLNSLPSGTLPDSVQPALGPDATALGQVYWYTLEGRDPDGNPVGGWGLEDLRTVQDWYVRYALQSADGVSEVASVGGFVQEYQVDVDPDAMRAHGVRLDEVFNTVRLSNLDVGARTIELNRVEYVVRGLGFVENLRDLEQAVIKVTDNVPIRIQDIGVVSRGPALRRGALDKAGAEAVGGVVVVRYGDNPLRVIQNVKAKVAEIAPGLPRRVVLDEATTYRAAMRDYADANDFAAFTDTGSPNHEAWLAHLDDVKRDQWPDWVTTSQVTVVPFYDRTGLIYETLGTLATALYEEILVTLIVVLVMVRHLRSALLVGALLPLAVLMCFIAMKQFGVDANIVALSGIAIAIGTMVDMGIIMSENILKHLAEADPRTSRLKVIYDASREVASAVLTAVATTVISFLPVFTMMGAEGKLFQPLAFTKTFALIASVIVALVVIPPAAHLLLGTRVRTKVLGKVALVMLLLAGLAGAVWIHWGIGGVLVVLSLYYLAAPYLPERVRKAGPLVATLGIVLAVGWLLTEDWLPLGVAPGMSVNVIFVGLVIGGLLLFFQVFQWIYVPVLRWCLDHKILYLFVPASIMVAGLCAWLGAGTVFGWVPAAAERVGLGADTVTESKLWQEATETFPGLGKEFMPPLDEGSFLYMPTMMPHASIGEALEVLQFQDKAMQAVPEVDMVVGKIGRVDSPLDPAPVSMVETVVTYKSEYKLDEQGHRARFRYDAETETYPRDEQGELIPDEDGRPFRQWRDEIQSPDDIWEALVDAADIPGTTSAPKLQPIAARLVMLQSGMRAPMGIKIKGPDLQTIEDVGLELEQHLKEVPGIAPATVFADRIVGKPYLEIAIDRDAISRYGLKVEQVQQVIEVAVGGRPVTMTVEGRERYPVRVRYQRELRDDIETLGRVLVPAPDGAQIPLEQLADIRFTRGPQAIKSEDTFLVGYVLFDKKDGYAEVDVVESAAAYLDSLREDGSFVLPAGVSYTFAGNYQNQVRAQKTLRIVLPVALFLIFLILYLQFRSVITTGLVFTGIFLAWSGGFALLWAYGQPWFLDVTFFGTNMRDLFQVAPVNLSVAIWVGFLALFGIATDDGVVIATYLDQSFAKRRLESIAAIREATVRGARRRIRPCLMTSATTILALLPVLTSTGRGSDVMVPMAIPTFGGMLVVLVSVFLVPTLYCATLEARYRAGMLTEEERTSAEDREQTGKSPEEQES
jgi:Cu(I)/Ag(I) efflux system membrane protein CusA/SilA